MLIKLGEVKPEDFAIKFHSIDNMLMPQSLSMTDEGNKDVFNINFSYNA